MLMLGLHAVGLKRFLELISDDTKVKLRKLLQEQDIDFKREDEE